MDPQEVTRQIASFTGLDNETVSTQLVPYLNTLSDAQAVRHHLGDLIGPGTAQASFTQRYVEARWPPAKTITPREAPTGASVKADTKQATKPFNSAASPQAGPSSPRPPPSAPPTAAPPPSSTSPFDLVPNDAIKKLDSDLATLTGDAPITTRPRACFCRSLRHSPSHRIPICTSCGLIQCSLNSPPPLHPGATCPSCHTLLLGDEGKRAALVAELSDERVKAQQAEQRRVDQLRAQRAARDKAKQAGQAVDVFPELGGGVDSRGRQQRDNVNAALGRGGARQIDGLAGTVAGGNSPTPRQARVLTIGKKGKVMYGSKPAKKKKAEEKQTNGTETASTSTAAAPVVEEDAAQQDDDLEDEREQEELQRLGFVIDPDDDCFRSAGEDEEELDLPETTAIERPRQPKGLDVRYVPADERPAIPGTEDGVGENGIDFDGGQGAQASSSATTSATRVPGSAAPRAPKRGGRRGKGRGGGGS
ncbi:hypothetical protein BDZ90DRAFT_129024 [Jaminaea rosea]|uniref:TRIP4/RQT4 C2HC5-type zinc finger domain-containing protein n=1 Tax=Jaminaea rosea TaxID=1569628 RepID=A0A316UTV3_9BASI|nr:hypothetical protein BDZ90DRAFT_129024 [Jaminaea rosea]PWN28719.1 hypothetical protein BDZ90DRAFT_129024 [Jaminaea rosea]